MSILLWQVSLEESENINGIVEKDWGNMDFVSKWRLKMEEMYLQEGD